MKTIKCLAILLMLATSAHAGGKRRVQFDVCAIDPGGKLGVYEVTDKQATALVLAKYLEGKTKRRHFVVVEELTETGDVK